MASLVLARLLAFGVDDTGVGRALSWLTRSHGRACAALGLLALLCYLPGIAAIPPVDRDEARFVQATKQMLETGNYIDIRIQNEERYKKPVGIYWLQAALVKTTGHGADAPIWAYRLASVAGALAAVLLTYWATLPLFGRRAAFVAATLLCTSLVLTAEAHLAKTDAVLAATVVLAMGALARLYLWRKPERPPLLLSLTFWIGLGLGILIKGPIGPMVAGFTILMLVIIERRYAWLTRLRPLIGIPVMLLIVLPWFVAIFLIAGVDFFEKSLGSDMIGKIATGQEAHGAPPGTHFALFWLMFWPGTLLVPLAIRWVWQQRGEPAVRFCLAWIVPTWLVFEAVATKLPHYTLPTYPAIAALVGGAVVAGGIETGRWWTRAIAIPPAIFAVAVPVATTIGLFYFEHLVSGAGIVLALASAALAVGIVRESYRDRAVAAAALLCLCGVVAAFSIYGVLMPQLRSFQISSRLVAAIDRAASCPDRQVASAGYEEASLIFLAGTQTRLVDGAGAADFLAEGGCRVAVVTAADAPEFHARAKALGLSLQEGDTVDGYNLGRFGPVSIATYRSAGAS